MPNVFREGVNGESAVRAAPIVPNNETTLPNGRCRAIWVGSEGDLNVTLVAEDGPILHKNVPTGIFPVEAMQVVANLTTADDLVAWY